ncbi:P-loop containing nucleoside triphosphate hydrolase protein [Phaeosphaeria sp. MPI-PUGE-AT-0046c]|nr:P-loop containing nucleoside triphosphate hydrolase protein [Phaeosphaeria sp. MPI-PUGE-AT-0046c]
MPLLNKACTARNVHWMVPRSVNSLFIGRSELVQRIQNALRNNDLGKSSQKRLVITGIGGIGKSEVCLQVADLMREDFWGVFWVDVGNPSTAKNGFLAVAKALGFSAKGVEESLQLLSNTKDRWLLVLDNADDPEFDYAAYIPSGNQGAVIITSRVRECSQHSTLPTEALEGLDEEHSTQLLLKAAHIPKESWQSCKEQARAIVGLLGSHTLALIQAGAYIAENYCQLSEYAEEYKQLRKRLLRHYPKQQQSRYQHVYATFEASITVLNEAKDEVGRDALDLLAVFSMLHSDMLPLHLFRDAWKGARHVLEGDHDDDKMDGTYALEQWHVSQLPEFIDSQANEWDDYRLNKACALLTSLSLVTRHRSNNLDGLSMHPLAHAWAKDRLEDKQQQAAWMCAGCLLAMSWNQPEMWQMFRKHRELDLKLHLQSLLSPSVETMLPYDTRDMIIPILLKSGWALYTWREDNSLESLLQGIYNALQIVPHNPSKEHIEIWNLAGLNLTDMGYIREAVELLKYVVQMRKTSLSKTSPLQLDSQCALAVAYTANRQTEEAIGLLEHVVKVRETTLAETHHDRLASQHNLALAYNDSGQTKEAIELLEHVVKIRETTVAETHPEWLASQHVLAMAYLDSSQTKEAIELLEHVVKIRETTLAETHPDRLTSQHVLAIAYLESSQTKEAIVLLEHVVKVRETTLAETHPDRLTSQHVLAIAYLESSQTKEAIELLEHVVKVRETTLAETHPDRLASQYTLALAYWDNSQTKEAVRLLEHVVKIRQITLPATHPDRQASEGCLAFMQSELELYTS